MTTPETTTEATGTCGCTDSCGVPAQSQVVQIQDACSLPEVDLQDRLADIRSELMPRATRIDRLENGRAWEFPSDMRQTLDEFVAFERECCSGLTWTLEDRGLGAIRLSVEGIDPDAPVFSAISKSVPSDAPARGGMMRVLKAGGIGFGVTFFLCCILPIALAAFVGGGIAATFAKLDNPAVILTGSVIAAIPAWWFIRRREARVDAVNCGPGC